jgi:hypothetical protein
MASGASFGTAALLVAGWFSVANAQVVVPVPLTLSVSLNPASPVIPSNAAIGTIVGRIIPLWNNGSTFTGTVGFGSPYSNDGGCFAVDGSLNLVVNCDLSGDGGTVQNVTITATQ